jgi:hypothetical protein
MLAALALIAGADWLFADWQIGSWLGGLALAWGLMLVLIRPALRRGPALIALGIAVGFALAMINQPGLLAWVLFWVAISIATLLPRAAGFDDAWRWAIRLAAHAATGPFSPLFDLPRLFRPRPHLGRLTARALAAMLALPIAMSALFITLFASANPLIARAFADIRLPSIGEVAFWLFALAIVWPSLRPRSWATRIATLMPETEVTLPGTSLSPILISLALFNTVFAIQNGLDLAFLWSGAPLPAGVSLAEYAHRGAYPLIVTALLAGVFVLATMKPGSATATSPAIRRLVVLWVAQNLLLVASSILRTCDYIAVYMLTTWRIAALAWMMLVALGLVLICWRMLTNKSARWLINWNALVAAVMLTVCSIVDLNAVAAEWNVSHAKEVGGRGVALDLCGLNFLRGSALLPLIELEQRPLDPRFRDRVRSVRQQIMGGNIDWQTSLVSRQANWRTWTWRNSIRLEAARRLLGSHPAQPSPIPQGANRDCDGAIDLPARPPTPTPPLTNGAAS